MYVQYGCGLCAPSSWRNYDASPTLRIQRLPIIGGFLTKRDVVFPDNVEYGDIVSGMPLPGGSCQGIYCSHVLEHLSLNDLRKALRETHRILADGGLFRLVVPDLEHLAQTYLESQSTNAAIEFMRASLLGKEERKRSIRAFAREWFGNSQHLWLWDYKSLRQELAQVGFCEIRRAQLGDSVDPRFHEVEEAGRWDSALGMECRREGL
jgi:predicted SAM-dependent methyltransferase